VSKRCPQVETTSRGQATPHEEGESEPSTPRVEGGPSTLHVEGGSEPSTPHVEGEPSTPEVKREAVAGWREVLEELQDHC